VLRIEHNSNLVSCGRAFSANSKTHRTRLLLAMDISYRQLLHTNTLKCARNTLAWGVVVVPGVGSNESIVFAVDRSGLHRPSFPPPKYIVILLYFNKFPTTSYIEIAGDPLDGIKMHTRKHGIVNRMFGSVLAVSPPKPAFETAIVIVTTQYLSCFEANLRSVSLMTKR